MKFFLLKNKEALTICQGFLLSETHGCESNPILFLGKTLQALPWIFRRPAISAAPGWYCGRYRSPGCLNNVIIKDRVS